MDGKFPELWMPPLIWRYAHEVEQLEAVLKLPTKEWADKLLNVHPSNVKALDGHIVEYAEKWKNKKKPLFGKSEGQGASQHKITGAVELPASFEFSTIKLSGADKAEDWSDIPPKALEKWTVKGQPFPFDPLILDTMTQNTYPAANLPVRLFVEGALFDPYENTCRVQFEVHLRKDMKPPIQPPVKWKMEMKVPAAGPDIPVIGCLGVKIVHMDYHKIELMFPLSFGNYACQVGCTILAHEAPDLFPPHGKITSGSGYWIPNPKGPTI